MKKIVLVIVTTITITYIFNDELNTFLSIVISLYWKLDVAPL